jgi:hypothetical protein
MKRSERVCKTCGRLLDLGEFYHDRGSCKDCVRKRVTAHRKQAVERYVYDNDRQMLFRMVGKRKMYHWNENMIADLKRYYPNTLNADLPGLFGGISASTIHRKAVELGLRKSRKFVSEYCKENGLLGGLSKKKRKKV